MNSSRAIVVERLSFAYDECPILENLSFTIRAGEFLGIIGPNGGGKTTFLKLLMGFVKPTQGLVTLGGVLPIAMRCKMGYVPQIHRVDRDFPITVAELVLLGALSQASPWRGYPLSLRTRADLLLDELGLTAYRGSPFGLLSGGLAQRALLARALLADPDFLFLDEPTAHIDVPSSLIIGALLERLKGAKTILFVTHDLRAVKERVDRILCIDRQAHIYSPNQICTHVAMGLYNS